MSLLVCWRFLAAKQAYTLHFFTKSPPPPPLETTEFLWNFPKPTFFSAATLRLTILSSHEADSVDTRVSPRVAAVASQRTAAAAAVFVDRNHFLKHHFDQCHSMSNFKVSPRFCRKLLLRWVKNKQN